MADNAKLTGHLQGAVEAIGDLHKDVMSSVDEVASGDPDQFHHVKKFLDHWQAARDQMKADFVKDHSEGNYLKTSLALSGVYHHLQQAGEHMQTGFPGSISGMAFQYHLPLILAHVQAYQTAMNE